MIIIPERSLVVLQPPRTGSTSLRAAIKARYPQAKSLYRHLERGGIPDAYAGFDVACMIRNPVERLHSLWRFMRTRSPDQHVDPVWAMRMRKDANVDFSEWLVRSTETFTYRTPPGHAPAYHGALDAAPATRKSIFAWARPDLGPVELLRLEDTAHLQKRLDLCLPQLNAAPAAQMHSLTPHAADVINTYHAWDLLQYGPNAEHRIRTISA